MFLSPPIAHASPFQRMAVALLPVPFTMKPFAKQFYNSPAWHDCRNAYAKSKHNLCERCLANGVYKPGEIVHHKIHLTPININDPMITLNWNNLELVCRDCHADIHQRHSRRIKIDGAGRVLFDDSP